MIQSTISNAVQALDYSFHKDLENPRYCDTKKFDYKLYKTSMDLFYSPEKCT